MPTLPPLTHHEILTLVAPFSRRGRHVDLAASDRLARQIAFKPVQHPASAEAPATTETLRLDCPASDRFTLTRTLARADGLGAQLVASGAQPAELLARLEAVPPARHFARVDDMTLALSHRAEAPGSDGAPSLLLERGETRAGGLHLLLAMPEVRGVPAMLELTPDRGDTLLPTDDLLAVLGADWGLLTRGNDGWRAPLKLRKAEPARTAAAELALTRTAQHLARTLAEPPAQFHARHAGARWRVAGRRVVPALVTLALIGGAAAVPYLGIPSDSVWRLVLFTSPSLLMVVIFNLDEIPRIEIPPPPLASRARAWLLRPGAQR